MIDRYEWYIAHVQLSKIFNNCYRTYVSNKSRNYYFLDKLVVVEHSWTDHYERKLEIVDE